MYFSLRHCWTLTSSEMSRPVGWQMLPRFEGSQCLCLQGQVHLEECPFFTSSHSRDANRSTHHSTRRDMPKCRILSNSAARTARLTQLCYASILALFLQLTVNVCLLTGCEQQMLISFTWQTHSSFCYGKRMFIPDYTTARDWTLSWTPSEEEKIF